MTQQPRAFGLDLPEYPWESVAPYRRIAAEHSEGTVDLSIGTPVDPTPLVVQDALAAASSKEQDPAKRNQLFADAETSFWLDSADAPTWPPCAPCPASSLRTVTHGRGRRGSR